MEDVARGRDASGPEEKMSHAQVATHHLRNGPADQRGGSRSLIQINISLSKCACVPAGQSPMHRVAHACCRKAGCKQATTSAGVANWKALGLEDLGDGPRASMHCLGGPMRDDDTNVARGAALIQVKLTAFAGRCHPDRRLSPG